MILHIVFVLLIAYWEWLRSKQLEELKVRKKTKGQFDSTGATGWNLQRECLALLLTARRSWGFSVWVARAFLCLCVCGTLSILFHGLQCESNFSAFLEYILADINNNISFYGEQLKFLKPQVFQFCKAHAMSILHTDAFV